MSPSILSSLCGLELVIMAARDITLVNYGPPRHVWPHVRLSHPKLQISTPKKTEEFKDFDPLDIFNLLAICSMKMLTTPKSH